MIDAPGETSSAEHLLARELLIRGPCSQSLADQQAKSLRMRMFMGSPKKPSGPFLNSPALNSHITLLLVSKAQPESSILLKGVSGSEEKRVCMLYFCIFRRKTCSRKSVQSFPERGFGGACRSVGHSPP